MSEQKLTAEEFVRSVVAKSFNQSIDNETLLQVAKKVKEAVATKPRQSRNSEAA
jgi:hypothetical protein